MTSTAPTVPTRADEPTTPHQLPAPIPFLRLVTVEWRKLFDTTTNRVLSLAVLAMIIGLIGLRGIVTGPDLDVLFGTSTFAFATLLPVLGILSVTGEFSHRTALTTFALEPRRVRVLAAKCLPPVVATVLATGFAAAVALPVTAVIAQVQGVPADWTIDLVPTLGRLATHVLLVGFGLALGLMLLNAPAAIVLALGSMTLWTFVPLIGDIGVTLRTWLDLNSTTGPLAHGAMTGIEAAQLATSVAVWIVAPLAVGIVRIVRKEVQ